MATPIWNAKEQRWTLRVTNNGITKKFTSVKNGIAGKKEVLRRSREWLENGSTMRYKSSVADVWKMYLKDCEARNGRNSASYKNNESIGRLFIIPILGKKRVNTLTKTDFQNILNNAKPNNGRSQSYSKEYLRDIRSVFNLFIKFSYENNFCDEFRGALYIPKGHTNKEKEILQPHQIKRLFEPSNLQFHRAFCFMVSCGLRPSECLGLKWSDIDGDTIKIKRGINARGFITDGKNNNARRTIPLNAILVKLLDDQREATKHLRSEWIFCDKIGANGTQDKLRRDYDKLKSERGLVGSAYTMRHTFISMVKNSMPEQLVKSIVGHSASMDTFGVYGHMVDGELKQAAEISELVFKKVTQA